MGNFWKQRWVRITLIVYLLTGVALWFVPLFNILHAESSAVIAGVVFFVIGLVGINQLQRGTQPIEVLRGHLSFLLLPWLLLTITLIWQPNCSYGQGFLFYLIFTIPSAILAVSFAFLASSLSIYPVLFLKK